MRTMTRLMSLLIVLCLLGGLAACSSGTSQDEAEKESGQAQPETAAVVKVGYDISTSATFYGGETLEKNAWSDLYQANGIKLDILFSVDSATFGEKLSQCVMAGNYPDVFRINSMQFRDYVNQGAIREVGSLLEEYGSDRLKAFYETEAGQIALKAATVDGKIYSLPVIGDPASAVSILWVRKDWLDRLGLKAPETAEEFVETARAFTKDDPDGDGKENTYGFTFSGANLNTSFGQLGPVFGMFGTYMGFGGDITFIEKGGKAVFGGADTAAMKKGLAMLQDMYAKGYIEKSFVTAGKEQVDESAASGKVGMVIGTHYTIGNNWADGLTQSPGMEWIGVLMPGETRESRGTVLYNAKPGDFNCLSSQCENPEAFIKMMNLSVDYLASPENMSIEEYAKYHGDGSNYTGFSLAPVRVVRQLKNYYSWFVLQDALKSGDAAKLNAEQLVYYNNMKFYLDHKEDYKTLGDEEFAKFKTGLYNYSMWGMEECANKIVDDAFNSGNMLKNAYLSAPTQNMADKTTTLNTLMFEAIVDIILGNSTVDSYDDYLAQWRSIAGNIEEEAQLWYSGNMKAE